MALFGLLGGGDSAGDPYDIYGDLFSEKQRAALREQQSGDMLAKLAAGFAKAAEPSPVKRGIGQVLGMAGGALAGTQDQAMERMLKGMKTAEDIRQSRREAAILAKVQPLIEAAVAQGVPRPVATRAALQQIGGGGAPAGPAGPSDNAPPPPDALPPDAVPQPAGPGGGTLETPWSLAVPPRPPGSGWSSTVPSRLPYRGFGAAGGAAPAAAPEENTSDYGPQAGLLPPTQTSVGSGWGPQDNGVLPQLAALYQGGGGGSGAPFRLAGGPGQAGDTGLPDLGRINVEPLSGQATPAGNWERDKELIKKYESGNRNIEQGVVGPQGGYNPSTGTVTGPSSASGYYQMIDPTWRSAAAKAGIDIRKYPRAIDAPAELQEKAAEALYRERGLADWAPYNSRLAAATGYQGAGTRGLPDVGRVRVEPLGGEAAPAAGGGGVIPGLNMTPEGVAALSALMKMGGIKSDPLGPLLEGYYKSPQYLREKATIEETAQSKVKLEYGPLIKEAETTADLNARLKLEPKLQAAIEQAKNDPKLAYDEKKAIIDRLTEQEKQIRAAGLDSVEVIVTPPGEAPRKITITKAQLPELTTGRGIPALGIPPMSAVQMGAPVLSPQEQAAQTQRGKTAQEMREVDVWTPSGTVKQTMTNQEIEARQALAAKRGGGAPQLGDIVDKPSLTPADQKISDSLGEEFITLRKQAQAADKTIRDTHSLRAKLDSGMFTGLDANFNLFMARLGDTLGWKNLSEPEKVKNTETYIAGLGSEVLAMVKDLRPASNTDLIFAQSMVGGQNMSAASIRQLLDMREEYARLAIQRHNEEAAGRNPAIFQGARRELPMPPPYQLRESTTPSGNRATINR